MAVKRSSVTPVCRPLIDQEVSPCAFPIQRRLSPCNTEINRILKSPELRLALAAEGADPIGGTPAKAARSMVLARADWGPVLKVLERSLVGG